MSNIFIVGAPRSGTNALRDLLCSFPSFITWPCDELNYAWKFSNRSYEFDDLEISDISLSLINYLHRLFNLRRDRFPGCRFLVEKTCANCLRVPFVNHIFPNSIYIYIRRNPYDAIYSSTKRWKSDLNLLYLLKKALYVPKQDLIFYATQFIKYRTKQFFSLDNKLPTWGPRFQGIDYIRQTSSLAELCLYQWYECCKNAEESLFSLSADGLTVIVIDYNDFAVNTEKVLCNIFEKLDYVADSCFISRYSSQIHSYSIDKGVAMFAPLSLQRISSFLNSKPPLPYFNGTY